MLKVMTYFYFTSIVCLMIKNYFFFHVLEIYTTGKTIRIFSFDESFIHNQHKMLVDAFNDYCKKGNEENRLKLIVAQNAAETNDAMLKILEKDNKQCA